MKILIVTQTVDKNDSNLGFFVEWITEFAKRFEKVTVICLRKGQYAFHPNIRVLSLGKEDGGSKLSYLMRFRSFIAEEQNNYDVVFVHMNPIYLILGGLFWRKMGKKVMLWYTHKSVDWKLRWGIRFATYIATASKESFRLKSDKVFILGHGIDTETFVPSNKKLEQKNTRIVTVGRMSPSKGYEVLLRAIKHIENPIQLIITGVPVTKSDEQYFAHLKTLARTLGLDGRVDFKGAVEHEKIPALLNSCDVFVNMSKTGSLDKAVLEAMSCGVPTITSNESFRPILDRFGLMFREGDDKDLARVISGIIERKGSLVSLGAQLRDIVVSYHSLPKLIEKIRTLYETGR